MGPAARRSRGQARNHLAYWARPQTGTLTYVALGDSAGVGVGVDDPQRGYVGVIADRLAETTGHSVRTVNLSVSGARAHDVLNTQIPQLSTTATPDVLTCVIGGNDVAWAPLFRTREFAEAMQAITTRLPEGFVVGLVPYFLHWPYEGRARKANEAIGAAAKASGHSIADIHTATKSLSLARYLRTFASDRFHPNERGHALWAEALWEQIAL
ncbi:SGNH/GDSL hydrolase family protein [Microbacterium sp. MPKO10]|uniref:SGNH/GDSL hydrolase family protein n=1 Tax=Microbacterium sp. MPKO10 TaxID=2989818 RepID=UPI002235A360|nr:SGNH/GDSL hydrolase family protein [Microbacterium sp. MPKO10]MCW4457933.1 SGNH/GDSL hydrolase family protein [Microbacterium sp. MPKO10]